MTMKEKQEQFLKGLLMRGLVDERKLAGVANAERLPDGSVGFCLMCLKGSTLDIYDTNFQQEVGQLLYSIDLKKVSNLKTSTFILNCYIQFTYEGFRYRLTNCLHKELYKAIKSETLCAKTV